MIRALRQITRKCRYGSLLTLHEIWALNQVIYEVSEVPYLPHSYPKGSAGATQAELPSHSFPGTKPFMITYHDIWQRLPNKRSVCLGTLNQDMIGILLMV